jgi:hypothetical protein
VHDVFVIQIHGEKRWAVHPPVHPDLLRTRPWAERADAVARRASGPPVIAETLRPGDVLYLPRGWIHSATALGGTSIHLTIGVEALTRWDIVEQVVAHAVDDPRLRQSLPLGISLSHNPALNSVIDETTEHLRSALRSADSAIVSAALARKLAAAVGPEPVPPIATVESLGGMGPTTVVRWRRGLDIAVESDAEAVRIVLARKTVSLPAETEGAIRALANGQPAEAGKLEGLDPQSSVVVSRRLVREGVLILA